MEFTLVMAEKFFGREKAFDVAKSLVISFITGGENLSLYEGFGTIERSSIRKSV